MVGANRTTVLSKRSAFLREPNPLALAIASFRESGREALDLGLSNPTRASLPIDRDAVMAALAQPAAVEYDPEPFGLPSARRAVSSELARDGVTIDSERIVLTASTSEAYGFAFKLLCDPGDEVLVPAPSYPLLEHLAQLEHVRLRSYRLAYDGAWHIDLDSLRRARTPRTRAVVVVSPNNPTGSYLKRSELGAFSELGLPVVSDEVFARYPLVEDAGRVTSALSIEGVLVLALGGLSKLAALPQMKLAWMLLGGPEAEVSEARERLELIADCYLSVAAPVQLALPGLLEAMRPTATAIATRARRNLATLRAELAGSAADVLHVEGGWYAVVRLPRLASEEEWVVGLLEREGVLVQPGWFFDFPDEPYAVISLLTAEVQLAEGARRIRRWVDDRAG